MGATVFEARALTARRCLWLLAPVAVSALAAGLAAIDVRRSFTLPEVESVLQSERPWRELIPIWHADASGSLYLALLKGWLHVGSAEWIARLPSLAAVALTAALVYMVGARLVDRQAGLAAGVLFAASAYTTGVGGNAGPIALAVLAATLATWLFVVAIESGGAIAWSAYAIVAALSVYIHASCAFVLIAHAAALVLLWPPISRQTIAASAFVVLLASPVVVQVLASHRRLLDALSQPSIADVARAVHDTSGRNVLLIAAAVGGAVAIALGRTAHAETWKLGLLATWATVPPAAVLVLSIARPSLDPRYLAVATPAISLLGAVGLLALPRRELAAAAALVTVALAGVRLVQLERSTTENWRAATAYALFAKGPEDRVVVAPPRAITAFSYYSGRDKGSLTPGGPKVFVVVRADDDATALATSRRAVRPPAYALRGERRFGRHLWVQEWDRTGLP